MDQHPELEGGRDRVGEDHMFLRGQGIENGTESGTQMETRVYIQVCGQDVTRDDGLIYERMLREECGVETRLDVYTGFGHVFWGMGGDYPKMEMSERRMRDSVEGGGWLLRR